MNEEEIFLEQEAQETPREFEKYKEICEARDRIVGACDKCDNGFIERPKQIKKIEDMASATVIPCDCWKLYQKVSKQIISGFPPYWHGNKLPSLRLDRSSFRELQIYLQKITEAKNNGIGVFFHPSRKDISGFRFQTGISCCIARILFSALDNKYTTHYILMSDYFDLCRKSMDDRSGFLDSLISEIENVDFLAFDQVELIQKTNYELTKFSAVIRSRWSKRKPLIIGTAMPIGDFTEYFGRTLVDYIESACVKICINDCIGESHDAVKEFIKS